MAVNLNCGGWLVSHEGHDGLFFKNSTILTIVSGTYTVRAFLLGSNIAVFLYTEVIQQDQERSRNKDLR